MRINWNDGWYFTDQYTDMLQKNMDDSTLKEVRLPHTMVETPYNCFDESIYQVVGGYKRVFWAEDSWKDQHVLLTIEAAGHYAEVFLNEQLIKTHENGYTAFSVDLAPYINWNGENILVIKVDSRESLDQPPFGRVIDYMTYGGLYREVWLDIRPKKYITDVFAKTVEVSPSADFVTGKVKLICETTISEGLNQGEMIRHTLYDCEGNISGVFEQEMFLEDAKLWSVEHPALYKLKSELLIHGEAVDCVIQRIGLRKISFTKEGLFVNEEKIKIRGLNRHQCFPYVGYAMPKHMQYRDAELLKSELKVNAVRTSHYPQSHHFLNRCDEIGILVFTEIPGWQHIGGEKWKEIAVNNTKEMILQYRNHPSIFIWGVRINESMDDDAFYAKTNEMAHKLDDTRPTTGVRYIKKSHLLEDVYSYNDFSHDGKTKGCLPKQQVTPDTEKGYLISEYNGHMFPTKSFDSEDHRTEHMLRHARVIDGYYKEDGIAGGFGWCMFDYNTHRDFGSGDRICYHGVMDMFRNHKLAAFVYAAQGSDPVLEINSAMDIGEHPGGVLKEVYAVTNADAVRVYKNNQFVGEFTKKDTPFSDMPHGPIKMDDMVGELLEKGEGWPHKKAEDAKKVLLAVNQYGFQLPLPMMLLAAKCVVMWKISIPYAVELYNKYIGNWGGEVTTYRFEAIRDGKVCESRICTPASRIQLQIDVSSHELKEEDTYDVSAIRIKAVDEHGNFQPWFQEPVELEVSGALELIGPHIISLKGGMGGTFVKTIGKKGTGMLKIKSLQTAETTISFTIEQGEL